ncbi:MAG: hypothetical protein AAGG68_20655, partial [Bacteroidota bacterium]
MNALINTYPVFYANQVLTHNNLNSMVSYLEQQQRYTRICTIGMGIICGLEPSWDEEKKQLHISAGCGVTSEGYLVYVNEKMSFNAYDVVTLRGSEVAEQNQLEDLKEVWELKLDGNATENLLKDEEEQTLENKVAFLLFECKEDRNDLCGNNCDEQGAKQEFRIRIFLMEEEDARGWVEHFYDKLDGEADDIDTYFKGAYGVEKLYIERFRKTTAEEKKLDGSRLTSMIDYVSDFQVSYRAIIERAYTRLEEDFGNLSTIFKSVYIPISNVTFNLPKLDPKTILAENLQYRYDQVCDMIETYNELLDVLSEISAYCTPNIAHFPKHLFLGKLFDSNLPNSIFRTNYLQPFTYNYNNQHIDTAKLLVERLQFLANNFNTEASTLQSIVITPSKSSLYPLSQRAIPFYYKDHKNIYPLWNGKLRRRGLAHRQYTYERLPENTVTAPYNNPLVYSFLDQDFLRIEGHIGRLFDIPRIEKKDGEEIEIQENVAYELELLRKKYNLAFDIVYLKLGGDYSEDDIFQFDCDRFEAEKTQYVKLFRSCYKGIYKELVSLKGKIEQLNTQLDDYELTKFNVELFNTFLKPEGEGFLLENINFRKEYDRFQIAYNSLTDELNRFNKAVVALNILEMGAIITSNLRGAINDLNTLNTGFVEIEEQLKEVQERHLFHCFATHHPGLEHKGGVPIGGTFVVVYIEESLQDFNSLGAFKQDVKQKKVIADFYLPYSCCSSCPPVAYLIDRFTVKATLFDSVFCENERIELQINPKETSPNGGYLIGAGIIGRDGDKYILDPAKAEYIDLQTGEIVDDANKTSGTVRLTYVVDKQEVGILVDILPAPDASFEASINIAGERKILTDIDNLICRREEDTIHLSPKVDLNAYSLQLSGSSSEINISPNFTINPLDIIFEEGKTEATLVIRHLITEGKCESEEDLSIVVRALPDANFEIRIEEQSISKVCSNEERAVLIVPTDATGTHTYTARLGGENGTAIGSIIVDSNRINPSALNDNLFGEDGTATVTIIHTVDTGGCVSSESQLLTIEKSRQIAISEPKANTTYCANEQLTIQTTETAESVNFGIKKVGSDTNIDIDDVLDGNVLNLSKLPFTEGEERITLEISADTIIENPCLQNANPIQIEIIPPSNISSAVAYLPLDKAQFKVIVSASVSSGEEVKITFDANAISTEVTSSGLEAIFTYEEVPV